MILTPQQRFDYAVKHVLEHEGGFSNDKNDPGGATNYGISLRFLKEMGIDLDNDGDIDINDVKDVHFTDAVDIYKKYFWDKNHYEAINSLAIATKIFDMAVNMGAKQAHKIVQRACGYSGHSQLAPDGIMGALTIAALNEISLHGRETDIKFEIIDGNKWFYEYLVEEHPELDKFLQGWLNRAAWWPDAPN